MQLCNDDPLAGDSHQSGAIRVGLRLPSKRSPVVLANVGKCLPRFVPPTDKGARASGLAYPGAIQQARD